MFVLCTLLNVRCEFMCLYMCGWDGFHNCFKCLYCFLAIRWVIWMWYLHILLWLVSCLRSYGEFHTWIGCWLVSADVNCSRSLWVRFRVKLLLALLWWFVIFEIELPYFVDAVSSLLCLELNGKERFVWRKTSQTTCVYPFHPCFGVVFPHFKLQALRYSGAHIQLSSPLTHSVSCIVHQFLS